MAHSTERKVGLFFIVSLILLGVMLEVGEKWNPFNKKTIFIKLTKAGSTSGPFDIYDQANNVIALNVSK